MRRIVIFASGTGTNADAIMNYFATHSKIAIQAVFSNNHQAEVLTKATARGVSAWSFNKAAFRGQVTEVLSFLNPDLIVLAGFLWKIPSGIVSYFSPKRIVNIHPSLLPKYGGKGMCGLHVHKAVLKGSDTHTGITIHHVNDVYDQGDIIFQKKIPVRHDDSPEQLANRVHELEYLYYPKVIEGLLL